MINKNSTLIGVDFSLNKPAICILKDNKYIFISLPYDLPNSILDIYKKSPVTIINRLDNKNKGTNISEKMRYEIKNAKYLANLILDSIKPYIIKDTYIAFEGLSYGSSGNIGLQLSGYKYILMDVLSQFIPLENMFTYAPITIKKTAGCSEKGSKKSDIINAFKYTQTNFAKFILNNEKLFKTKKDNWIIHLDDFSDAYWCLKTLEEKLINLS